MQSTANTYRILSIDAWADCEPGSWQWNNWFHVGDFLIEDTEQGGAAIIEWFIAENMLKESARESCEVEDDGYNFVIQDKETGEPLYAIEYGADQ